MGASVLSFERGSVPRRGGRRRLVGALQEFEQQCVGVPLLVVALAFGTVSAVEIASLVQGIEWEGLNTTAFMLVLPYALARWASGREVGAGLVVLSVPLALTVVAGDPTGDLVGGAVVLLLGCAIGFAVR